MQREIKFRAWDGLRMTTSGIQFSSTDGKLTMVKNMPLMQYTGLKDRNGVEIYEGDIVYAGGDKKNIAEVYYSTKQSMGAFLLKNSWTEDMIWTTKEIKVIGNIYEHSHLLDK